VRSPFEDSDIVTGIPAGGWDAANPLSWKKQFSGGGVLAKFLGSSQQ